MSWFRSLRRTVDKEGITNQLVALGYPKQQILTAIQTLSKEHIYFDVHQVVVEIHRIEASDDEKQADPAAASKLAPYFYADECPDHHYDLHVLPWTLSSDNHKALQFGQQYNDVAVHSELLKVPIAEQAEGVTAHAQNKKFMVRFISLMLTHQCPRFDISTLEAVQQQSDREDASQSYLSATVSFVDALLHSNDDNDCLKQLIIYQYPPNHGDNDTTDLHGFQLQAAINRRTLIEKDREFFKLWSTFKVANGQNELSHLRRLLNQCQGIETQNSHQAAAEKLPLFVHHFYPKHVVFGNQLEQVLKQKVFGLFIPQQVISTIVAFAITVSNEMYFDSWYLARNAQQSQHKLVTLWHRLLFDEKVYTMTTGNSYHGTTQNTWIPSPYLLANTENSLQQIADSLIANRVLHVYRPIIWSILLYVNPLNARFDRNANHLVNSEAKWFNYPVILYQEVLKWDEWLNPKPSMHSNTVDTFHTAMMYVFGGNAFNALYALNRVILVNEYEINGGSFNPYNEFFARSLDARMDEIYPLLIPDIYKIVKSILEAIKDAEDERGPFVFSMFHPGLFNPLLKCYLMELMFFHGMDALVLTFAAYMTLASSELIECYSKFASSDDFNAERMLEITRSLYAFNDVKAMARLYAQYRQEIMSKHADKITLKQNALIMDVDYRQPPPHCDDPEDFM